MDTGSFSGLRRQGCHVEHLRPSSAEAKERVQVYYSPAESSECSRVNYTFTFTKIDSKKSQNSTYRTGYVTVTNTTATGYGLNLISHPHAAVISHMKRLHK
jgi:hypothetical protein